MANLFFIHTPLELFVAQQIIRQESLKNNIMISGYVGDNKHFYQLYDLMLIQSMWNEILHLDCLDVWAEIGHHHIFQNSIRALKNFKFLNRTIKRYQVTSLLMGDMNNYSVKFSSILFDKRGIKICIFEEGSSHYHFQKHPHNGGYILNVLLAVVFDLFYFRLFYKVCFGKYCFLKDMPFEMMPIFCRYSIRPLYSESFDKQLFIHPLFSDQLKSYLNKELEMLDCSRCVLFLSQPVYEDFDQKDHSIYFETLARVFEKYDNNKTLIIKYHPREKQEDKHEIEKIINQKGIRFKVVGKEYNVPIEYYLQFVRFDEILCFFTSTIFYDGYIYEDVKFNFMLQELKKVCELRGLDTRLIDEQMRMIDNIILSNKK